MSGKKKTIAVKNIGMLEKSFSFRGCEIQTDIDDSYLSDGLKKVDSENVLNIVRHMKDFKDGVNLSQTVSIKCEKERLAEIEKATYEANDELKLKGSEYDNMVAREGALLEEIRKIQAEIAELEDRPAVEEKTNKDVQMFRDYLEIGKHLTNVHFVYDNSTISGHFFNMETQHYDVFDLRPSKNQNKITDKLYAFVKKNCEK